METLRRDFSVPPLPIGLGLKNWMTASQSILKMWSFPCRSLRITWHAKNYGPGQALCAKRQRVLWAKWRGSLARGDLQNVGHRTQDCPTTCCLPNLKRRVITSPGKEWPWKKTDPAISKPTYYLGAKNIIFLDPIILLHARVLSSAHQISRLRLHERTKL